MLTKEKSKQVFKLKYVLLIPMLMGMLFYTSCEDNGLNLTDSEMIVNDIDTMSSEEDQKLFDTLKELSETGKHWEFLLKDENSSIRYKKASNGSYIKFNNGKTIDATMIIEGNSLTDKINDLRQAIISKDTLSEEERNALAMMIYKTYPDGVGGISGEKGKVSFDKYQNFSNATAKYNQLVAERKRLLRSSNEKNPIIVSLDTQLKALKKAIDQEGETVPFAKVDEVPVFPGCEDADDKRKCFNEKMHRHISKNFNYPKEAQKKGVQGMVSIMLTIDEGGSVTNIRKRGPDKLLENEAERIMKRLPKMKPGKEKGKAVNVPYSIPITFKLQDDVKDADIIKLGLSGGVDPVYFVDGKESSKEIVAMMNPGDIESISVLKGDAAENIYGEKGKNGVIQITTKKKE